jgi:predicted polyphosphate/ATP-dependent NAD kinase
VNPKRAVALIEAFLQGRTSLRELEVMDIDEDLFREGRVSARLYGYLRVPFQRQLIQGAKIASSGSQDNVIGIAEHIVENMADNWYYVLGPGTTVKAIGDRLGIAKTLLGVDVVTQGQLIAKDVNEQQLLATICDKNAKIIVTAIGGQGFLFGRGNQQISAQVIRQVGKENLIVVATKSKLLALDGPLLVDTGDPECDAYLSGYVTVITSYKQMSVWKVQA